MCLQINQTKIIFLQQKQDFFAEFSPNLTLSPVHTIKKHSCEAHRPTTPIQSQQKHQKKKTKQHSIEANRSTKFENGSTNTTNTDRSSTKFENGSATKLEKGSVFNEGIHTKNGNDENFNMNCDDRSIEQNRSRIVCDCCINRNHSEDKEFLFAFVSINVKDKVLPQSFLKGKIIVVLLNFY